MAFLLGFPHSNTQYSCHFEQHWPAKRFSEWTWIWLQVCSYLPTWFWFEVDIYYLTISTFYDFNSINLGEFILLKITKLIILSYCKRLIPNYCEEVKLSLIIKFCFVNGKNMLQVIFLALIMVPKFIKPINVFVYNNWHL